MATQTHTLSQTSWIVWVLGLSTGWTKNKRLFNSTGRSLHKQAGGLEFHEFLSLCLVSALEESQENQMKHLEGMSNQLTSHHALWMNTLSIFVEKAHTVLFFALLFICKCLVVNYNNMLCTFYYFDLGLRIEIWLGKLSVSDLLMCNNNFVSTSITSLILVLQK